MDATLQEPLPHPRYETDEFVVFPDVPVFKEHTRNLPEELQSLATDEGGRRIEFTREDLERIIEHCNHRIDDTGDVPVITIARHNDDGSDQDPEVVGIGSHYKLGMVGRKEPKYAILTDLRIFKEDADRVKKYPRLSVEYWAKEGDPTGGYFDPITLLGAKTPELDLGLRFEKGEPGFRRLCYSRMVYDAAPSPAAPSGSNTFVPGVDNEKKRRVPYEQEKRTVLSQEDLNQIVEALTPVVQAAVSEAIAPDFEENDAGEVDPADGGDEEVRQQYEDDDSHMDYENADDQPSDEEADDAAAEGERSEDHHPDEHEVDPGEPQRKPAEESAPERELPVKLNKRPTQYSKENSTMAAPAGRKSAATPTTPASSAAQSRRLDYKKQFDDLSLKYQKLNKEHAETVGRLKVLEAGIGAIQANERRAVRYSKLKELEMQGYTLDTDVEVAETADLSDEKFGRHLERIKANYHRVPLDSIPYLKPSQHDPRANDMGKRSEQAKEARRRVEYAKSEGKKLDYFKALEAVKAEALNGAAV